MLVSLDINQLLSNLDYIFQKYVINLFVSKKKDNSIILSEYFVLEMF